MASGSGSNPPASVAPPAATRAQVRKETFKYLIEDVLELELDDPLLLAFKHNSIDSVPKILILTEKEIDNMVYSDGTSVDTLPISSKATIRILKDWNFYLMQSQGIRSVQWLDKNVVNRDEFDIFRTGTYDPDNPIRSSTSISNATPFPTPSSSGNAAAPAPPSKPVSSQANEFRRGIKRDKSHYTTLRDEKQWDEWKRTTVATVYAHGCENILSNSYSPATPEEVLLFKEQNNFMYDVFVGIIKTNMGKYYVRNQDSTRDAQAVWRDYTTYMRTSTRADIQIEDLMTSLTSLRLDSGFRKTTQSFIVSWLDQLRQYEELTPTSARFPDIMKKAMLQNALNNIPAFRTVKNTEQLEIAQGRGPLGYNEYVSLVQKVAANVDRDAIGKPRQGSALRTPPNPRQVNVHESADLHFPNMSDDTVLVTPDHHADFLDETGDEEIPDTFGSLSAYATNRVPRFRRRPTLRKETWQSLSKEDQLAWDQISEKGKYAIMYSHKNPPPSSKTEPATRQAAQTHILESTFAEDADELFVDANQSSPDTSDDSIPYDADTVLVNNISQGKPVAPSDIRRVLRTKKGTPPKNAGTRTVTVTEINSNGYTVSRTSTSQRGALIDRGANGGLAGSDVRVISRTDREVDVSGIDGHQMTHLPIVSAGGVTRTQRGDVIVILNQYAHVPQGQTIHSCIQMEAFNNSVDDRHATNNGTQTIRTLEGFVVPLNFRNGLPYMNLRPFSDEEWDSLPHVHLTSDAPWDPALFDNSFADDEEWFDAVPDLDGEFPFHDVNQRGEHLGIEVHRTWFQRADTAPTQQAHANVRTPSPRTFAQYTDYFLQATTDVIQRTFDATTQFARSGWITGHIRNTFRSPFPALNVFRRNESVATDTMFSDTPAVDNGATMVQLFAGVESNFVEVYPMKSDRQFVNVLLDTIRHRGAMDTLISDRAMVEISHKVTHVLRHYCIKDWQSEPHFQHQNPAERRYQNVKHNTLLVLNVSGAPPNTWLLAIQYVCFIMNRMALQSLNWRTPFESLVGSTPDISMIYRFKFWDLVYYKRDESRGAFPSEPNEGLGRFVGFSETVGHSMTYKVLTSDTERVIYRSRIRRADVLPNRRADGLAGTEDDAEGENGRGLPEPDEENNFPEPDEGDDDHEDERGPPEPPPNSVDDAPLSHTDAPPQHDDAPLQDDDARPSGSNGDVLRTTAHRPMAIIEIDDILNRTFLTHPDDDGQRFRLRVIEALEEHDRDVANDPSMVRFRCRNEEDTVQEIITYNEILDRIEEQEGENDIWHFKSIDAHQGPLTPSDPDYKGSRWNVRVNWETGESTFEPLSIIAKSDPVTCAIYGKKNGLLHLDGWKRFARLARRQKKLLRLVNQAKLQSFRAKPIYMFGVQVPRSHREAMELDRRNGNTRWRDAETVELDQIDRYNTFKDLGNSRVARPPNGYKKITVHMVYAVKHDGRHKARLVAGGHLTETPIDSVYSSVVSLKGLRIAIFLAELNGMEIWASDVGNAYLEAYTDEKVYIVAGPEFGNREGHVLVIQRALYGLKSSGLRWWERCSQILLDLGFSPSKAEDDIWMRKVGEQYEYIARYVDDLAIVSNNPQGIVDRLTQEFKLTMKGTGPISYHLGCDFFRDDSGTLCMAPRKYIEKMIDNYVRLFGAKPKAAYSSPLEKSDHPELDDSDELDDEGTKKYQSLIGALQWAVSIGRFDIATAVMTMSKFRAAPRVGHLDRVKRIYGYLLKMKHATIRFRVEKPDYSELPDNTYQWAKSIYGDIREEIPHDCPVPLGNPVVLTSYVDANLLHDISTGRAVTGIIHLINQTPVDWYTKKQATVETATYGSEFLAARTATEQILDLRLSLRYLGIPIDGPTFLFGDNKTVVDSGSVPRARLHKRHVLLSFHRVREAVAAGVIRFIHIAGEDNPADVLSKAWGYQQVWPTLQAILFWAGNTFDLIVQQQMKGSSIP